MEKMFTITEIRFFSVILDQDFSYCSRDFIPLLHTDILKIFQVVNENLKT